MSFKGMISEDRFLWKNVINKRIKRILHVTKQNELAKRIIKRNVDESTTEEDHV